MIAQKNQRRVVLKKEDIYKWHDFAKRMQNIILTSVSILESLVENEETEEDFRTYTKQLQSGI